MIYFIVSNSINQRYKMDDIYEFLLNHTNTKRANKSKPILIKVEDFTDNNLQVLATYKLNFQYPSSKIAPTFIKIGTLEKRLCIRIDELDRVDRAKYVDYYVDDIAQLKKLLTHLAKLQRDYDRTIWFLRAQLIPSLFKFVMQLFNSSNSIIHTA